MNEAAKVEIVELGEIRLIGLCSTSPFAGNDPQVEAMKRQFAKRRDEISNAIHPERYVSPHFACEVLFTYMICMEVDDLSEIPEGMIGFAVPPHRYGKVKAKGDPYQVIHDYLNLNNLTNDRRALALEIYRFDNPAWPEEAEVLIPLT